jgi:hypothetical protein
MSHNTIVGMVTDYLRRWAAGIGVSSLKSSFPLPACYLSADQVLVSLRKHNVFTDYNL